MNRRDFLKLIPAAPAAVMVFKLSPGLAESLPEEVKERLVDASELPSKPFICLYVGSPGDLSIEAMDGKMVTLTNRDAGFYPVRGKRVVEPTTAGDIFPVEAIL